MKTKVSILFYAKRAKASVNGLVPIYTRITINGKRIELSTNRFVEISKWSTEAGKMKGNSKEARSINSHLDMFKIKIIDVQMELIHKNTPITSETLKNKLLGTVERQRTLIPIFKDHNNKIKELVGKEYAPGTLERYNTSLKHTIEFLEWKYNISDIEITKIDHAFITEYEFYLRSVRNCANNTAVKYIKNFNKIIKICLANHWIERNPFANYKSKVKEVERVYLSEEEIQVIIDKDFKNERLSLVRDIFLFSCFSGLAYIDVKNLTKSHISIGIDGEKWIFTHRQKTETASKIPVLPLTQLIIDKYENHPESNHQNKLFPILSNQKMNAYLKEIAAICQIDKELTFHIARHTFATTVTLTKDEEIKKYTLNARIETVDEKPSFRNSVEHRCLIIANGYYEWQWLDPKGKVKQKYELCLPNEELFAFAGLYSHWRDKNTGELKNTYTILTTATNPLLAEIHNHQKRMPVVLKQEDETKWLQHEPIDHFAYPYTVDLIAIKL